MRVSLALCWAAMLLSGCAGYHLGPSNGQAAGEKSVQITPFVNRTMEPRLTDAVVSALREELQRDGTYRLATHEPGDIVVTGTITGYSRTEVTFVPSDVTTARDYRLRLTAHVTARDRGAGKLVFDRPISGSALIRVLSDLPSTERQALPVLANDLAKNVTALLADGGW